MGFVYPQYWTGKNAPKGLKNFSAHLEIIKRHFGTAKDVGEKDNREVLSGLLSKFDLDSEQSLFKLCMQSNSEECMVPNESGNFDVNPLTNLWRILAANDVLCGRFTQYMKLAKMAVVMVMGSVDNERHSAMSNS